MFIFGSYEITQDAVIGKSLTVGNGLTGLSLIGLSGPPPFFQDKGGFVVWYQDRTNIAGYSFANTDNEWVLSASAQSDKEDQGVFAVDFDNGNTTIVGTITGAGFHFAITTKTNTDYTLTANDDVVLFSTGATTRTATLPAASTVTGKIYHIKKIDAGAGLVTIDGDGAETIDGDLTPDITAQYESFMIVSDGSNWHVI